MATTATTIVYNSRKETEKLRAPKEGPSPAESSPEDVENTGTVEDVVSASGLKKRKREIEVAYELEIDVSAPEPPSKKALRKAKKQKTTDPSGVTAKVTGPAKLIAHEIVPTSDISSSAIDGIKRSPYSIWIGNLPWTTTKPVLLSFLTGPGTIIESQVSRIHMPLPAKTEATKTRLKPQNKGFAYIDFCTEAALNAALGLSETLMGGRRVLIKDAKSFEGRPIDKAVETEEADSLGNKRGAKPPSRRIFIGNLSFDVTKEDLTEHFQPCGEVVDVHMATFEDSGKCKGYAWVTFDKLNAAEAAVRGSVLLPVKIDQDEEVDARQEAAKEVVEREDCIGDLMPEKVVAARSKQKQKVTRKSFVNRLQGRLLHCEFAEDALSRYKKRYGKDGTSVKQRADYRSNPGSVANVETAVAVRKAPISREGEKGARGAPDDINPGAPTDPQKRRGRTIDTRLRGPGTRALDVKEDDEIAKGRYRTGAITESQGTKVIFD